jgi:adenosine deaminase
LISNGNREAFARKLPKAELHVHLEGTISRSAYARIAARNGFNVGDLDGLFACSDFASFLQSFLNVVRVLRRPVDFAELASDYLKRSAADGVRHVEFFLSPATQRKFVPDLDLQAMVRAVDAAREAVKRSHGISSVIIFDMVRNLGEAEAHLDLDLAVACRQYGVVGVGLGGDERNFPARDFAGVFKRAKEEGLRRTVHAGEAGDAQSIVDAATLLHAERIGHGVAASGRPDVIALLRDRAITIDACPTSNRHTGAIAAGATHPLREFFDAGVSVTLNSDDPAFFSASIGDEYANAARAGFLTGELAAIARNSIEASFADEPAKQRLLGELATYVDAGMTR